MQRVPSSNNTFVAIPCHKFQFKNGEVVETLTNFRIESSTHNGIYANVVNSSVIPFFCPSDMTVAQLRELVDLCEICIQLFDPNVKLAEDQKTIVLN